MQLPNLELRIYSAIIMGGIAVGAWMLGFPYLQGLAIIIAGIAFFEWIKLCKYDDRVDYALMGAGCIYISFTVLLSFLWDKDIGVPVILVALTDIFAYVGGRLIGGPKLCPTISPNKTWAGFIVGVSAAGAGGYFLFPSLIEYWILAFVIGAASQGGDLLISFLKRRAGLKDTGNIIPGHGGILDRIDGYLLAFPTILLYVVLFT